MNSEQMKARSMMVQDTYNCLKAHPDGMTLKDVAIEFGTVGSRTIRNYIYQLIDEGKVVVTGKRKTSLVYAVATEDSDLKKSVKLINKRNAQLKAQGGKPFDCTRPQHHTKDIKQGDVVWCSSRSGEGEDFRYLVMVPWERKATVVCILQEGHPNLDLNNSRFVYLGDDTKDGRPIKLYADLSSFCSRGYAQFGQKIFTVEDDRMDLIKSIVMRYNGINIGDSNAMKMAKRMEQAYWKEHTAREDAEADYIQTKKALDEMAKDIEDKNRYVCELEEKIRELANRAKQAEMNCDRLNDEIEDMIQSNTLNQAINSATASGNDEFMGYMKGRYEGLCDERQTLENIIYALISERNTNGRKEETRTSSNPQ